VPPPPLGGAGIGPSSLDGGRAERRGNVRAGAEAQITALRTLPGKGNFKRRGEPDPLQTTYVRNGVL
jgi:hypothetical protein